MFFSARQRIGAVQRNSEERVRRGLIERQPDPQYLEALARRFAADACLPLPLARRRVMALAISARR
jgi:hypothetical protein